jgi:hypothetical protein
MCHPVSSSHSSWFFMFMKKPLQAGSVTPWYLGLQDGDFLSRHDRPFLIKERLVQFSEMPWTMDGPIAMCLMTEHGRQLQSF